MYNEAEVQKSKIRQTNQIALPAHPDTEEPTNDRWMCKKYKTWLNQDVRYTVTLPPMCTVPSHVVLYRQWAASSA